MGGKNLHLFPQLTSTPPQLWGPTCADRAELWGQGVLQRLCSPLSKGLLQKELKLLGFALNLKAVV